MILIFLHALHLHSFPFQDNKMFLNWLKFSIFLKSSGRSFHKTAAVYLKEFLPYVVVFTLGISTILEYLKLYLLFFKTTKSFKHGGDSLYNILKHSNAIVRILLICRDGTFAICKSSSYVLL